MNCVECEHYQVVQIMQGMGFEHRCNHPSDKKLEDGVLWTRYKTESAPRDIMMPGWCPLLIELADKATENLGPKRGTIPIISASMCLFIHNDIQVLYNVEPCPVEELPQYCTCGRRVTYGEPIIFINSDR